MTNREMRNCSAGRARGIGAAVAIAAAMWLAATAWAGGPKYVAGVSYFDPAMKGVPLTWAQGTVAYWTDQGDLSPLLPGTTADAFVADAFSRWTLVPAAALTANRAGQLGEDVSGANVIVNADGTISMPVDVLPDAVNKPVGIVYDADGQVTDALLGEGAGDQLYCLTNAVYGGPDGFATDGHLAHALVVINGNCAQTSTGVTDTKYRLIRALGRALGLDWSQVNINVITRKPVPTADDYEGYPVMHFMDLSNCMPITRCYSDMDQLRMDDRMAAARLYPVTEENMNGFPGKQVLGTSTARVHGSVYFSDAAGTAAQPMQGVNVVARWIDPANGTASRKYAATSVSGHLYRGYAGNPVTGYDDISGQRIDRFGSDDAAVEGFFDLAGLEFPDGGTTAQYEISVEAVDATWSYGVGPYGPWEVKPSGTFTPVVVSVSTGSDVGLDIVMKGGATVEQDVLEGETFAAPRPVPVSGDWSGTLSGYGDSDYFWFTGKADRTLSVSVTALDESGAASELKALPVIGMWTLASAEGSTPGSYTPSAFNSAWFGMSRLDTVLYQGTDFRIGISDERGDGRPDYAYRAHVLYGDTVTPTRASAAGGTVLTAAGIGFQSSNTVTVDQTAAGLLGASTNSLLVTAPALADGVHSITIADAGTGGSSVMTNALTVGAGATDIIRLIAGSNPSTPVGSEAVNPIVVRVLDATGVTPVAGASVVLSASPATAFSACGGAITCTVFTDDSGYVSTRATVLSAGTITITAALAPASYSPAKTVQTTLQGTTSALDLALVAPLPSVAQGATLDLTITARTLGNGLPLAGRSLSFQLAKGSGTLTATSGTTDGNGYASTSLHVSQLAADVQVTVCVQPGGSPCQNYYVTSVAATALKLEAVSGGAQVKALGQGFAPVTVRVTDSSVAPVPVRGASVVFASLVGRAVETPASETVGETIISHHAMPVILASSEATVLSDANGLASMTPSAGAVVGAVEIEGAASVGAATVSYWAESLWGAGVRGRAE